MLIQLYGADKTYNVFGVTRNSNTIEENWEKIGFGVVNRTFQLARNGKSLETNWLEHIQ